MLSPTDEPVKEERPSVASSDFLHDYLQKTDLSNTASLNQFVREHQIARDENETDEAFTKRVKKINYLNLAQQLIRQSSQHATNRQIPKSPAHVRADSSVVQKASPKATAPLKRMKPVFSPAEDPDFDDEFELDDQHSRDIYDESSSSGNEDQDDGNEDEEIYSHQPRMPPAKTIQHSHTFANDIKQKLSNLAADVVRTFGTSNSNTDEDLTKPLPTSNSFSSRLFSNRSKETNKWVDPQITFLFSFVDPFLNFSQMNPPNPVVQEPSPTAQTIIDSDPEEKDADLLYTNESLLPQVDWDKLEKQLKRAQVERERYDKVWRWISSCE